MVIGHFLREGGACVGVGGASKCAPAPLGDFLKIRNFLAASMLPDKELGPYWANVG